MAITELSLPTDIAWKRLAVSSDMIDVLPNKLFPPKWRSSIAIFYHEPAELPPDYCDRRVTYLKVVCTITNYQVTEDPDFFNNVNDKYAGFAPTGQLMNLLATAYPCYGALLHLSVFPNPMPLVVDEARFNFPYIQAIEPRKREIYEVVTQSGDVTSQSATKMNVLKGTTSATSSEDFDLENGGAGGGGSILWGALSAEGKASTGTEGTVTRYNQENQQVKATDVSREKRESHSFSTNLNQLYTQLQSYHLGTNRAMFLMQPRPHMQDTQFSFIHGLRRIEGIQEFFLIVNRPSSIEGICVEAGLETLHLKRDRGYYPRLIPESSLYQDDNLSKTASALGIDFTAYNASELVFMRDAWNKVGNFAARVLAADPTNLQWQSGFQVSYEDFSRMRAVLGILPEIGLENVAIIYEEVEQDDGWMFVTARLLCGCVTPSHEPGAVDCEKATPDNISTCDPDPHGSVVVMQRYSGPASKQYKSYGRLESAKDLNAMTHDLNQELWRSLASPRRVQVGEVSFLETDLVLDDLAQLVRLLGRVGRIDDPAIDDVVALRPLRQRGLGRTSRARTLVDLGALSTEDVMRDLRVGRIEAGKARREMLVTALREFDETTIQDDQVQLNLIQERIEHRIPTNKRRQLEVSALGRAMAVHADVVSNDTQDRPGSSVGPC